MKEPIRVLFVIPGALEGTYIFIRRQIESLARESLTTETFSLRSRVSPRLLIEDARRFSRIAREFRPQLVHAQFGTMTGLFAAALSPVPVIVSYRGGDLHPDPDVGAVRGGVGRLFSQVSSLAAARTICVSEELRRRLWWRRHACDVIPSGVDLEYFAPRPREDARGTLGWPQEPPIVLFNSGRMRAVKRLDLAAAAVEHARRSHPALVFKVLDGRQEPSSIPVMLSAADCLLVTSDFEGSPNIVKEALACNLPVVSVDVGDVRERLEGVENTRIAARSAEDLGDAVSEVLRARKRCDGRRAVQAISLPATAKTIVGVYRRLLDGEDGTR